MSDRTRELFDGLPWSEEKGGPVLALESAPLLASQPVAGESFNGGYSVCSDCHLDVIPCACCLECGQVQTRRMGEYERCAACQASERCPSCGCMTHASDSNDDGVCSECLGDAAIYPEHVEVDTVNNLGLSGLVGAL